MRPSFLFFDFFFFFFTAVLVAAGTETISSTDKRISYEGDWREVSLRVTWVARFTLIFDPSRSNFLEVHSHISDRMMVKRL